MNLPNNSLEPKDISQLRNKKIRKIKDKDILINPSWIRFFEIS